MKEWEEELAEEIDRWLRSRAGARAMARALGRIERESERLRQTRMVTKEQMDEPVDI